MTINNLIFRERVQSVAKKAQTFSSDILRMAPGHISETERISILQRLLPLSQTELQDHSEQSKQKILSHLRTALRRERVQGRAGHWTYDLNRHIALSHALQMEIRNRP